MRFIENMLKFRLVFHPRIVFEVLQICYRHLWYIVPQTVVFALVDTGLTDDQRERMAVRLHSSERVEISSGKPEFFLMWIEVGLSLLFLTCHHSSQLTRGSPLTCLAWLETKIGSSYRLDCGTGLPSSGGWKSLWQTFQSAMILQNGVWPSSPHTFTWLSQKSSVRLCSKLWNFTVI